MAVILGTGIHFALGFGGYLPQFTAPSLQMTFSLPAFSIDFLKTLPQSVQYLTIAIPFGILTIIGGINNTESARLAGDDYRTRDILLTEAFSSLIAAFFGGVAQTTPYIGHPAYKKMGATWWYTLLTGLLIGICSVVGLLSLFVSLIPRAVIAPIFIFIGFEIMRQAYNDSPPAHSPAVSLSILPVVASLVLIILGQFTGAMGATPDKFPVRLQVMHQTLTMLSNGFIITGLLWGSMLAFLIDNKARMASLCSAVCAVLTLFGMLQIMLHIWLHWPILCYQVF
jgi:AGZA family xanthine/uracil permease-like MFS transporter